MQLDEVESLRRKWTDRLVQVDSDHPHLARFLGLRGVVKTVNMSGRALVQFEDYHNNLAWHDIELSHLSEWRATALDEQ